VIALRWKNGKMIHASMDGAQIESGRRAKVSLELSLKNFLLKLTFSDG
jgi:hypothetical protein